MDSYYDEENSTKKIIENSFIFAEIWPFEKMSFFTLFDPISARLKVFSIIFFTKFHAYN